MAGVVPNAPGTGNNIPVSSYTAGISESFPNVNRQRVIESSINSKETIDFMPVNMGVNQVLDDRFVEFRINGILGSFIDLSSLIIEFSVRPVNANDLSVIGDTINISLVNGLANTIFKSVSVFLNEKVIESNPIYNYTSYIKQLQSINSETLDNVAKCGGLFDDMNEAGVTRTYEASLYADDAKTVEKKRLAGIKAYGVDIYFPLLLDSSSLDMYLLDGVDIRIRLEMASTNWIVKSNTTPSVNLRVGKAKLWVDRVTPHYNALLALNKVLSAKPLEYVFNKTLHKTFMVGANESSIMIDQPFGKCIPEKLTMVFITNTAYNGRMAENGLYFDHCNLSNTLITVNGSSVYNINTSFPSDYSHSYYVTQRTLGLDNVNLISYDSYAKGRSIFCFNFVNEVVDGSLPVELSASLRINLTFDTPMRNPTIVILLADTKGLLTIDRARSISCDVRG